MERACENTVARKTLGRLYHQIIGYVKSWSPAMHTHFFTHFGRRCGDRLHGREKGGQKQGSCHVMWSTRMILDRC